MSNPLPSGRVQRVMGMPVAIDVRDSDVPAIAVGRAFQWLHVVDATFSTYRADSEISRINRGVLAVDDAGVEVRAVLARCEELREQTGGYFDIRAPSLPAEGNVPDGPHTVDPSGFVKGWSVERAAAIVEEHGGRTYCINAGGDVRLRGRPEADRPWRIGIQHPLLPDQVAAVVESDDLAIATSGAYARGSHVVDPHTGLPPEGVLSVTVVGPDLATADALATAAFAMGRVGPEWTAKLDGYEALTILADETVLSTDRFPRAADASATADA